MIDSHTPAQLCVAFFITQKSKVLCLCRKFGKIQKNGTKGGKMTQNSLIGVNCVNLSISHFRSSLVYTFVCAVI